MGFKVPEVSGWGSERSTAVNNGSIFSVEEDEEKGVDNNIDNTSSGHDDSDGAQEDTVYPTKMTAVVDNVKSSEELTDTLSKVNSYDSQMESIADEYTALRGQIADSKTLKESWKLYEDKAKEIHKNYLTEIGGQETSKVFDQSFTDYLSEQRERYEAELEQKVDSDIIDGHTMITENLMERMKKNSESPEKLLSYTDRAYRQAEEEAELSGLEDPTEKKLYAKSRIIGSVEVAMDKYMEEGRFDDFKEYLSKATPYFDKEDLKPLYSAVRDTEVIEYATKNLDKRDGVEWQKMYRSLSPRLKEFVDISVDNDLKRKEEQAQQIKNQVRSVAQKELREKGRLKLFVEVDGKMHKVTPEDYK